MRIGIVSDLHLEHRRSDEVAILAQMINESPAEIIVIAGDLCIGSEKGRDAARRFMDLISTKETLYIKGNHDFYSQPATSNCDHKFVQDDFVAAVLWTNFWNDPISESISSRYINDFRCIPNFNTTECKLLNFNHVEFIKQHSDKPFVVTHFPPSLKSLHPAFAGDTTNAYFLNNMDILTEGRKLWIHGHVHSSFDYMLGGCRVICNPLGYPHERKVSDYKVVEVDIDPSQPRD